MELTLFDQYLVTQCSKTLKLKYFAELHANLMWFLTKKKQSAMNFSGFFFQKIVSGKIIASLKKGGGR